MTDTIEERLTFTPKLDEAGLIPAIAIEKSTGTPLMMAFMNETAINLSLETGYAHFWSRSRAALWQKGETSGNRLKLIEILTDCDQDSLCLMVEMEGKKAACHTGRRTCYYRRLSKSQDKSGPLTLELTGCAPLFDPSDVYK